MTRPTIVVLANDSAFQSALHSGLLAEGYEPVLQRWSEDASDSLVQAHPDAVVIEAEGVQRAQPPAEMTVEQLVHDPALAHIPVVVCADHSPMLESAVRTLHKRPGLVIASSLDADELRAKVHALKVSGTIN